MKTQYQDKILPIQPKLSNLHQGGSKKLIEDIYKSIIENACITQPMREFKLKTSPIIPMEEMGSNPIMLRMLEFLVLMHKPKKILEIGSFIGLSAMSMAKALPKGGQIITIEKFEHVAGIARANFENNGCKNKIKLIEGDAFEKFKEVKKYGPFNMVFIDGNKERYWDYFLMADPILAKGGLVIIDDIFFHGDALNSKPSTEKGKGVRRAMVKAKGLKNYHKLILPLANGYMLLIKK